MPGKNPEKEKEVTIGPGHYHNPDYYHTDQTGVSMKGDRRATEVKDNKVPGPGYYDSRSIFDPNSVYGTKGVTLKGRHEIKEKEKVVPPPGGYYNTPDIELNHKRNPAWTIPGKYPLKEPDKTPGPGEYLIKDKPKDGVSFKGRYQEKQKENEVPGPGAYNNNFKGGFPTHHGVKILEKFPDPSHKENGLGPGAYTLPDTNNNPKWSIQGKPVKKENESDVPGPGNYRVNPNYDGNGKAYTMQGRHENKDKETKPGPGQYDPRLPPGTAVKIGEKIPIKKGDDDNPGPGNYNSHSSWNKGTKIGRSKRTPHNISKVPGPGSYNDKRKPNPYKGRWSRTTRKDLKKMNTPGPGAYEIIPEKGPEGPKIQKRYKDKEPNDNPGPSHYAIEDSQFKGPRFTIGRKRRRKSLDDGPGPNHYLPGDETVRNNSPR